MSMALGVNFYNTRECWKKALSGVVIGANILVCAYSLFLPSPSSAEHRQPRRRLLPAVRRLLHRVAALQPGRARDEPRPAHVHAAVHALRGPFFSWLENARDGPLEIFLAFWQSRGRSCRVLKQLFAANKVISSRFLRSLEKSREERSFSQGRGIKKYKCYLSCFVNSFYGVIAAVFAFHVLLTCCVLDEGEHGFKQINMHSTLAKSAIWDVSGGTNSRK